MWECDCYWLASDCWCFAAADDDARLTLAHQLYKAGEFKQALEHSNLVYQRNPLRTDNLLLIGAIYYQVLVLCLFVFFNELVELLTCVFTWCDSCKIMICALLEMKKLFGSNLSLLSVMETWRTLGRWISLSFAWSVCYWQYLYNCDLLSLRKKGTLIVQSATTWSPLRFVQTLMLLFYLHYFFLTLSFGSISQLKPNYADAWSNLASAYMRKGRLSEATQCCQQALALNPLLVIFWIYDPFILIKKTSSSHLIMWFCFPLGWCT